MHWEDQPQFRVIRTVTIPVIAKYLALKLQEESEISTFYPDTDFLTELQYLGRRITDFIGKSKAL